MTFETPSTPRFDGSDDESRAWLMRLTPAELMAVTYWIRTGDTALVDAMRPLSANLRDFSCEPFDPADVDDVSAESCIREIDGASPDYQRPDYSGALPIHLYAPFQALSWREQTILRVHHWLLPAGDVPHVVGEWILNMLEAYPNIHDYETLRRYEYEWTIRVPISLPRPFLGLASGDEMRAFWYATGNRYVPPQYKRRRKALSPAETALCEEVIAPYLALAAAEPDDVLSVIEVEVMEVVRAAFEG